MSTPDPRLRRNPQVVYRELHEGGVLLHLDSGQYHGVNEIGSVIWELVDGDRTLSGIVAEVRARVEEPPAELDADVESFVRGLRSRDLIQTA